MYKRYINSIIIIIIIQKPRERSRKSRNAWKQFYYVTLNNDKTSVRHFVTLNLS